MSRTLRVLWALEEMGQPYEHIPAPPRDPQVVAMNGTGKIPVLRGDGMVISDSVAILTFLADRHDMLTWPAGSANRARQDEMTQYIVSEVDAALWTYAKHSFVLPKDICVAQVKDTARWEFEHAMSHLADRFEDGPYIAGDMLTIPDIILSHCAGWGLSRKFQLPEGQFGDYLKALRKRPAMQKVMALVQQHG